MDIKLLRAFVTLAQQGRFHAAADILCLTQPALTKQIQTLEHLMGVTLFLRGRQGAKMTDAGQQLYSAACELLSHYDQFRDYAREIQQGRAGKLTLGFGISSFQLAPTQVIAFRQQYPNVEVSLNDIPSDVQCRMLLEGTLQAGFIRLPAPEPLKTRILLDEALVLAIPADVTVDAENIQPVLEQHQLLQISPHRGRGLADQAVSFLNRHKLSARAVAVADDIQTLLAFVAARNGVALLPAAVRHIMPAGIKLVPLSGEYSRWQVGIAWNPAIQDVLRDKFLAMLPAD
ncbi:LysR substrate-binding domain-containing protein [Erwiniaceae bacterium BAC15a-03b]|uniref:LysR substrate-binding domain-containing protein n=1 Tax=Winslowiella arboricola TaxID=2978220 RepID=A0A9J6PSL0_9GAMM|nr:LysR family transcriptional regulator [Winslowiella arboricola]MCU5775464.1 LysR substrate-binding domain-containing protein [Winslowiella arboricola]MCU5779686.1 LysR substrate-binding domain-containing protein [Winslowiella arboricola]